MAVCNKIVTASSSHHIDYVGDGDNADEFFFSGVGDRGTTEAVPAHHLHTLDDTHRRGNGYHIGCCDAQEVALLACRLRLPFSIWNPWVPLLLFWIVCHDILHVK